jgi:hypothetical protein
MKINTKKCTPVPKDPTETCKVNSNPYISKGKQEEETKEDDLGRELTFLPELIVTPVLSSTRTHPKPYPRLSEKEVDDLTEIICNMLISDDKAPVDEKKKKSRTKDPVSTPFGRFEVEVIAKKSNSVVRVSRSLRLTAS